MNEDDPNSIEIKFKYPILRDYLIYVQEHGKNGVTPIFKSTYALASGERGWRTNYIPYVTEKMPVENLKLVKRDTPSVPLIVNIVDERGNQIGEPVQVTQRNHLNDLCVKEISS